MNWEAFVVGLCSFLLIGICHPLVIKLEYHFGKKSSRWILIPAVIFIVLSFFCESTLVSIACGVIGFSLVWSSKEIKEQHERVLKGRFPKNPKREYEY
ncbi:MAG: DUF4491 family protein [Bacteroidales bacterium]|nr:DUF4491 family protein [Bacteroidales bacterium]